MEHKIVFLDSDSFASHITMPRPSFPHTWAEYPRSTPELVIERMKDATIAIVNKAVVSGDVLDACPNLQMISISATGTDIVDVAACTERGIVVSNVRGYAVDTVPEHTFMLILALKRRLVPYVRDTEAGDWSRSHRFCLYTHRLEDLRGSRLGIIGNGSLGQAVAAIGANGFGMEVVYLEHATVTEEQRRADRFLPYDDFMSTSDVISIHCPLTPATENLMDLKAFGLMKETAIVVNTARGAIVSESDLVQALEQGMIGGAAIDVVAKEPPAADHPYLKLMDRPDFLLTPHVAWASDDGMQALADQAIENIENFVAGNPTNLVG